MLSRALSVIGGRKFALGFAYLAGAFGCIGLAVWTESDAGVIAAVAGSCISVSTGLAVVVWGNVQEHRASNGNGR